MYENTLYKKESPIAVSAISAAGERLAAAAASGIPCEPVRGLIGTDDIGAAYQVQQSFNDNRAGNSPVVGRKIGATSQAVQLQLGVDQPDWGVLFEDMQFYDGDVIPFERLLQPRVEAEIAFMLGADLMEGSLDVDQCRTAVAYAVAALEIVDSRIRDWDITFADTVADNASSGLYVLGTDRRTLVDFEPADVLMGLRIDGDLVSSGDGKACLGDPLNALSWLAMRAREFGDPLRAGQVVLSGALGPIVPVQPGSTVRASIRPLGVVSATFSAGPGGSRQEER
jgi:2-keto-4-pentenoate hydratase